ncbi:hypothetical protein FHS99_001533 [Sphingomonas prati]|uniref:Uncharacterized protein n=1 Tax=Sphingomonas prati TaxID=1843237 RepID=A0A7W9BS73_9SPHN|nr:hypothetical protein [Sphingomonas prati]
MRSVSYLQEWACFLKVRAFPVQSDAHILPGMIIAEVRA